MSTQSQGLRGPPTRGSRRKKAMLDLNAPPNENREQEGTSNASNVVVPQEVQVREPMQPAPIDVEALDDDVVESSPRAFAQAKHNNAQRAPGRSVVVDVDSGRTTRLITQNNWPKRRRIDRVQSNQTIISCGLYINLESSSSSMRESSHAAPKSPTPPPKEPTFNCPICMGALVDPTSTKCGHIFCKGCIKTAIAAQAKCPTCRKRVTVKELIRVFLPSTS